MRTREINRLAKQQQQALIDANGNRQTRILSMDDVVDAITKANELAKRTTDNRPCVMVQVADGPVANAYQYRAYRTVVTVKVDALGNFDVDIHCGSANGNGKLASYGAIHPENKQPWHRAYRVYG